MYLCPLQSMQRMINISLSLRTCFMHIFLPKQHMPCLFPYFANHAAMLEGMIFKAFLISFIDCLLQALYLSTFRSIIENIRYNKLLKSTTDGSIHFSYLILHTMLHSRQHAKYIGMFLYVINIKHIFELVDSTDLQLS